jgi:hypothetical protein
MTLQLPPVVIIISKKNGKYEDITYVEVEWIHIIAYFKIYMLKINAIAQTGIPDKVC